MPDSDFDRLLARFTAAAESGDGDGAADAPGSGE